MSDFIIENGTLKKYIGKDENVIIPDGVTSIGYAAFGNRESPVSIIIPDSVMNIGESAFWGCISLDSVVIPDSVTSIGESAFWGCISLASVTIGGGVTSVEMEAFQGCTALTNIVIPDSVTSVGCLAFQDCTSLASVTIGGSVTNIGDNAFEKCTSLASIVIPNSVTSIGKEAFQDCTSLSSVTIGGSVTNIGKEAFSGCTKIRDIKVPSEWAKNETAWFKKVFGETKIGIIALQNFDKTTKLTKYVLRNKTFFLECLINNSRIDLLYKLLEYSPTIDMDALDEMIEISIKQNSTEATFALIEYKNKKYSPSEIEKIEQDNFEKAIGLKEYTISYWKKIFKFKVENDTVTITGYKGKGDHVDIPEKIGKNIVTEIGYNAFFGCTSLTGVTIPDSVTSIGDNAFEKCKSLVSATIPESVTRIGWAFFLIASLLPALPYTAV